MIMLLHLTRVEDVMCWKHMSFLFLGQKKKLEVNVGEMWNLLSVILILENQGNPVLMKSLMIPSSSNETNGNEFWVI